MIEIALGIAVCWAVAKLAAADDHSGIVWFCVTFGICVLCWVVPIPFVRFLLAGVLGVVALMGYKAIAKA